MIAAARLGEAVIIGHEKNVTCDHASSYGQRDVAVKPHDGSSF